MYVRILESSAFWNHRIAMDSNFSLTFLALSSSEASLNPNVARRRHDRCAPQSLSVGVSDPPLDMFIGVA